MGTDIISRKLSRVYYTPSRAKKFAEPYAEKMKARGYRVRIRTGTLLTVLVTVVDVFCKR